MQRLAEELVQGRRVVEALDPIVRRLRAESSDPVRVVDVGCGLGYQLRWLAAHGGWGDAVELVGVDLDASLIAQAARLADAEGLDARFVAGDAFRPGVAVTRPERTVVISSGLLHHLPGDRPWPRILRRAATSCGAAAFAHWDTDAGPAGRRSAAGSSTGPGCASRCQPARRRAVGPARPPGVRGADRGRPRAGLRPACADRTARVGAG